MLDINFIRAHQAEVEHSSKEKGYKIDVAAVLDLDTERKTFLQQVESLRQSRNEISSQMKNGKPSPELIEKGKQIKAELADLESKLSEIEANLKISLKSIPNVILPDVPLGPEENSVEVKVWGTKRPQEEAVDHLDYATARDWVDFERGAKVAGSKGYYLKNELALLENALLQYGLSKVLEHGFNYLTVPDFVSSKVLEGTGFNPRTSDQSDEYFIEGEDLALIATAEIPITGYHMDEIIDEDKLPLFYAAIPPVSAKRLAPTANSPVAFSASTSLTNSRCTLSVCQKIRQKSTNKFSASKKRFFKVSTFRIILSISPPATLVLQLPRSMTSSFGLRSIKNIAKSLLAPTVQIFRLAASISASAAKTAPSKSSIRLTAPPFRLPAC